MLVRSHGGGGTNPDVSAARRNVSATTSSARSRPTRREAYACKSAGMVDVPRPSLPLAMYVGHRRVPLRNHLHDEYLTAQSGPFRTIWRRARSHRSEVATPDDANLGCRTPLLALPTGTWALGRRITRTARYSARHAVHSPGVIPHISDLSTHVLISFHKPQTITTQDGVPAASRLLSCRNRLCLSYRAWVWEL